MPVLRRCVATVTALLLLGGATACSGGPAMTNVRACGQAPGPSTGPAASLVTVGVAAARTATGGEVITVTTSLVVAGDAVRVVLHPATSALLLMQDAEVAAWVGGDAMTDHSVPMPLTGGTTRPAQVVPRTLPLIGCDGRPLPPGVYGLQAVVGYSRDPLDARAGAGAFQLVSAPAPLTVE